MKKRIRPVLLLCLAMVVLLGLTGCKSEGNPYTDTPDDGFVIDELNVEIDASAGDRSMEITESYVIRYFNGVNHGFYRDIAVNSGEKIRNVSVSAITDAATGREYSAKHETEHEANGNLLRIAVRDPDVRLPLNTPVACTVKYTMITPRLPDGGPDGKLSDNADVLAVNAVGQGWTCKIARARIRLLLPASARDALYYLGPYGSDNGGTADAVASQLRVTANADKTQFDLETLAGLPSFSGVTVYYRLPKGTFRAYSDLQTFLTPGVALALIALVLLLKFFFGRNRPLTPVTNFYPPKNKNGKEMDPVEAGYLIDNTCSGSDTTSLVFYWASKGYLRLEGDDDTTLVKLRDLPDDAPEYQKTFFNRIFSFGDTVSGDQLTNKTYTAVTSVQHAIAAEYGGKLYSGKVRAVSVASGIAAALFAFLSVFLAYLRVDSNYLNPIGIVALIPVVLSFALGSYIVNNWLKLGKKRVGWLVLFGILIAFGSLLIALVVESDVMGLAETLSVILGVAVIGIIAPFIARRTDFYNAQLNEIIGFREFLTVAEKNRLEMLLEENPQYYYDVLPYANVLGVSEIWEKKFENLTVAPPDYWATGDMVFSMLLFNRFYRTCYLSVSQATVSRPSSSSRSGGGGGGFGGFGGFGGGGGGFSGGGFGGGGGGRC